MIGENDVPGEVFYLDDAVDLTNWAAEKKIGRLSMWSANRNNKSKIQMTRYIRAPALNSNYLIFQNYLKP